MWDRCGRHNSPPASSVMDFIFRRCDGSHVSVDTVHPALLRFFSPFSSPRWYHLQSLYSDVVFVSPLYVAKPPQSCFPAPLCDVLYFLSLPDKTLTNSSFIAWYLGVLYVIGYSLRQVTIAVYLCSVHTLFLTKIKAQINAHSN